MPSAVQHVATLHRVPLFNDLTATELSTLALSVTERQYEQGEILFSEGDPGGDLLIVKEGAVKILKTAQSGRQQLLAIERAGSSLGEVSAFDEGPYSATALTI